MHSDTVSPNKRHDFLSFIHNIARRKFPRLHILVLSREQKAIEVALTKCGDWKKVKFERNKMRPATRIHILNALKSDPQLEELSGELKASIILALTNEGSGK
jgi:hypothetical protein